MAFHRQQFARHLEDGAGRIDGVVHGERGRIVCPRRNFGLREDVLGNGPTS
jgi:hypothetical protein